MVDIEVVDAGAPPWPLVPDPAWTSTVAPSLPFLQWHEHVALRLVGMTTLEMPASPFFSSSCARAAATPAVQRRPRHHEIRGDWRDDRAAAGKVRRVTYEVDVVDDASRSRRVAVHETQSIVPTADGYVYGADRGGRLRGRRVAAAPAAPTSPYGRRSDGGPAYYTAERWVVAEQRGLLRAHAKVSVYAAAPPSPDGPGGGWTDEAHRRFDAWHAVATRETYANAVGAMASLLSPKRASGSTYEIVFDGVVGLQFADLGTGALVDGHEGYGADAPPGVGSALTSVNGVRVGGLTFQSAMALAGQRGGRSRWASSRRRPALDLRAQLDAFVANFNAADLRRSAPEDGAEWRVAQLEVEAACAARTAGDAVDRFATAVRFIASAVEACSNRGRTLQCYSAIGADELLPAITWTLIQADARTLASTLWFVDEFAGADDLRGERATRCDVQAASDRAEDADVRGAPRGLIAPDAFDQGVRRAVLTDEAVAAARRRLGSGWF
ncbi:hypothetical protein JL720_13861 [Aureococcus anophagefferens]|nr:hypothetical protein JL720_13861 [Aureococcus anophagefferens]